MLKKLLNELKRKDHQRYLGGLDFFKYIGPGLLVTVGFIDPGNWASNFAAGSEFGYTLIRIHPVMGSHSFYGDAYRAPT